MDQEVQQWLRRVMVWQECNKPIAMPDQLQWRAQLANFLQQLQCQLQAVGSVGCALDRWPQVGQLLGRLCTLPALTVDRQIVERLVRCLLTFWTPKPETSIEAKAKAWARTQLWSLLCHLSDHFPMATLQQIGTTQHHYNHALIQVLRPHFVSGTAIGRTLSGNEASYLKGLETCMGPLHDESRCDIGMIPLANIESLVISLLRDIASRPDYDQHSLDKKLQSHPLVPMCSRDTHAFAAVTCILQHISAVSESCPVVELLQNCLLEAIRHYNQNSTQTITATSV